MERSTANDAKVEHATIMVVDDNPLMRKVVRITLQSEGYVVCEAEDGQSALKVMSDCAPDLILQDLVLPDIDGVALVKQLRALPGGAEVPILALSGFPGKLQQARSTQAGF